MSKPVERAPIAVSMGEPAGIGGEIALKAWLGRDAATPPFFLIDDPDRLKTLAQIGGLNAPVHAIGEPSEAVATFQNALPILPMSLKEPVIPGVLNPANGPSVMASIEKAVRLVEQGKASAVVTNPLHKACLYEAGFRWPGHTEYLAELAGIETPPVMMLACSELRVVPVTIHIALEEAVRTLRTEDIVTTGRITAAALKRDFGIDNPRLAVAGLNPHAGEDGAMGTQEKTIIEPAINALRASGIEAFGPLPSDTLFHAAARTTYDAVLCMYHDQALIPIKTIDFEGGVNVTLGLPFVRTSPDHGTALSLAGTGKASERSLVAALHMASDMAARRAL